MADSKFSGDKKLTPQEVVNKMESWFEGFQITFITDKSNGSNNYIIEHKNKDLVNALSDLLFAIGVKGGSGNKKYVAAHRKNGIPSIILIDDNIPAIQKHEWNGLNNKDDNIVISDNHLDLSELVPI